MKYYIPQHERLMKELETRNFPKRNCVEWGFTLDENGYGKVHMPGIGSPQVVSRVALAHKLGRPIKPKHQALHICDNPCCYNPNHLFEGTRSDNMQDMMEKGRSRLGLCRRKRTRKERIEDHFSKKHKLKNRDGTWACEPSPDSRKGVSIVGRSEVLVGYQYILELSLGRRRRKKYVAAHECDNRSCINPLHITEKTQSQNIKDCVARGRHKAFTIPDHMLSPEQRERCRQANLGRKQSKSEIDKRTASLNEFWADEKRSKAAREKISEANRGPREPFGRTHRQHMRSSAIKRWIQKLDPCGVLALVHEVEELRDSGWMYLEISDYFGFLTEMTVRRLYEGEPEYLKLLRKYYE